MSHLQRLEQSLKSRESNRWSLMMMKTDEIVGLAGEKLVTTVYSHRLRRVQCAQCTLSLSLSHPKSHFLSWLQRLNKDGRIGSTDYC